MLLRRRVPCLHVPKSLPINNKVAPLSTNPRNGNSLISGRIPTMHFQKSMPKLPIPKLEDTIKKFTEALQPILNESEFQEITSVLKDFEKSDGLQLHKRLIDQDKSRPHTSYITDYWFDMYLKDRRQIPFTHTPLITTIMPPGFDSSAQYAQSARATNTIISALKFKQALESNKLYPDIYHMKPENESSSFYNSSCKFSPPAVSYYVSYVQKSYPLDMSQYKNLFSSTRIPREGKDELVINPNARNVVFMRNGHPYSVDVLSDNGEIIDGSELQQNIEWILQDDSNPAFPAGAFTTMDRDSWTGAREKFLAHGYNREYMRLLDGAIFVVSLEDYTFQNLEKKQTEQNIKKLLVGDGSNRWFDKCLNLIFLKDGTFGLQFEHSWGDGISVVRFINDVCKDSFNNPVVTETGMPKIERKLGNVQREIRRLKLKPPPELQDLVVDAMLDFQKKSETLQVSTYIGPDGLGKNHAKSLKISPDSLMQLAIQLGYFKLSNGKCAPTYESCTTAAFKHGRTETIRACTNQTKKFCEAFFGGKSSKSEMQSLLKECSDKHNALTRDAATGKGCDRHLFAMKQLAMEHNEKLHALYRHELYDKVHQFILSTSTVPSEYKSAGGFCPVVPDGFGVGYEIKDDNLGFIVTSYGGQCHQFTQGMNEIVKKMSEVMS